MGRPSKLTPDQRAEVARRLASGETVRDLAAEFKVGLATIQRIAVSEQTERTVSVAKTLASAQTAMESANKDLRTLPLGQQIVAVNLADKLRNISSSLASAAEMGAATAYRLHALANSEVGKVDDANPLESVENLRNVGVLTKLGNSSAEIAVALLNANTRAKDAGGLPGGKEAEEGGAAAVIRELKQRRAAGGRTAMVPGLAADLDDGA